MAGVNPVRINRCNLLCGRSAHLVEEDARPTDLCDACRELRDKKLIPPCPAASSPYCHKVARYNFDRNALTAPCASCGGPYGELAEEEWLARMKVRAKFKHVPGTSGRSCNNSCPAYTHDGWPSIWDESACCKKCYYCPNCEFWGCEIPD